MADTGKSIFDSFSREVYFPTMVFNAMLSDHEELNTRLLELIYTERDRDQEGEEGSQISELGGWHSRYDLHRNQDYRPIIDRVHRAAQAISNKLGYDPNMRLQLNSLWSIINPPKCANQSHIHPGNQWSGVYYVQAPKGAGDVQFTDPRTAHVMNQPYFDQTKEKNRENWTHVSFEPEPGKLLIFPSWLYHHVDPNMTEETGKAGDRVIMSFNMYQV